MQSVLIMQCFICRECLHHCLPRPGIRVGIITLADVEFVRGLAWQPYNRPLTLNPPDYYTYCYQNACSECVHVITIVIPIQY